MAKKNSIAHGYHMAEVPFLFIALLLSFILYNLMFWPTLSYLAITVQFFFFNDQLSFKFGSTSSI